MAIKNQAIATANPSATANSNYINALYKEAYWRDATKAELTKFAWRTVKDAANIILWSSNSPFSWKTSAPSVPIKTEAPAKSNLDAAKEEEARLEKENLDKAYAYIDKSAFDDASKLILRQLAMQQYKSNNKIYQWAELDKVMSDATLAATWSLDPYYTKETARDIEDLKNKFADIRNQSIRSAQQEQKSYSEKLKNAKDFLRASGRTFSSAARDKIGAQSAVSTQDVAWVEGSIPQQRRYDVEDANAKIQEKARDLWVTAERELGSSAIWNIQSELWTYVNPYKDWIEYNPAWTGNLYLSRQKWTTWYVETWDKELERLKEIEKAKQERVKSLYL